jgi:hypothetical protein
LSGARHPYGSVTEASRNWVACSRRTPRPASCRLSGPRARRGRPPGRRGASGRGSA